MFQLECVRLCDINNGCSDTGRRQGSDYIATFKRHAGPEFLEGYSIYFALFFSVPALIVSHRQSLTLTIQRRCHYSPPCA